MKQPKLETVRNILYWSYANLAMPQADHDRTHTPPWARKLSRLLARRRFADAMRYLDKVIERDYPLFDESPETLAARRMVWLCRIDLSQKHGTNRRGVGLDVPGMRDESRQRHRRGVEKHTEAKAQADPQAGTQPKAPAQQSDGWEGVAGMRELKAILDRDIILPLQEPELYRKYRVGVPNGVLLYGPPGCGKTFIAQERSPNAPVTTSSRSRRRCFPAASTFTGPGIGEPGQATKQAPVLVFFDELDALVPDRSGWGVGHRSPVRSTSSLCSSTSVRAAASASSGPRTTSRRGSTRRHGDPGVLDKHVYVGPPDLEAPLEAVKLYMKKRPQEKIDWFAVADTSDGYSFAELEHVVNEAARCALADRRDTVHRRPSEAIRFKPFTADTITRKIRVTRGFRRRVLQ